MFFHVQRKLPLCLKRLKAKKQFSQRIDHTGKKHLIFYQTWSQKYRLFHCWFRWRIQCFKTILRCSYVAQLLLHLYILNVKARAWLLCVWLAHSDRLWLQKGAQHWDETTPDGREQKLDQTHDHTSGCVCARVCLKERERDRSYLSRGLLGNGDMLEVRSCECKPLLSRRHVLYLRSCWCWGFFSGKSVWS